MTELGYILLLAILLCVSITLCVCAMVSSMRLRHLSSAAADILELMELDRKRAAKIRHLRKISRMGYRSVDKAVTEHRAAVAVYQAYTRDPEHNYDQRQ